MCGNTVPSSQVVEATDLRSHYRCCQDCAYNEHVVCDRCGTLTHNSAISTEYPGSSICYQCLGNNPDFVCTECRETYPAEHQSRRRGVCRWCRNADQYIREYGYDPPQLNFHGIGKHLGAEIETLTLDEPASYTALGLIKLLNAQDPIERSKTRKTKSKGSKDYIYIKKDISILENLPQGFGYGNISGGFEIVTHPATLEVHKQKWQKAFDDESMMRLLQADNVPSCGLHIHIGRNQLTPLGIGKIVVFVNNKNNRDFIVSLAGRVSEEYAKLDERKKFTSKGQTRREAVNLKNSNTIELRIFRSTLNKKELFRQLEFAEALVNFAAISSHSLRDMYDLNKFFDFVAKNKKRYPNLEDFCFRYKSQNKIVSDPPEKLSRRIHKLLLKTFRTMSKTQPPRQGKLIFSTF